MVSGRGKARGFFKKDIRERKTFTFWIYDFRKKAKENIWNLILGRHEVCVFEEKLVTQDCSALPLIRLCFFQCFNCSHSVCFWKDRKDLQNRFDAPFEKSIVWEDGSNDYF